MDDGDMLGRRSAPVAGRLIPTAGSAIILTMGSLMNGSLRRFNRDRTGRKGRTRFLRPIGMVVALCLTAGMAAVAVPAVASAAGAPALFTGRAIGGGRYVAEIR